MRTTIRLADEDRETLLSLAHERGTRSVSAMVEEAVTFYLSERNKPVPVPPPPPGRWERIGADIDRRIGNETSVVGVVRALVQDGLHRVRLLRA